MNYTTLEGGYAEALQYLLEHGGQFFPARHPDASNTIVKGNDCVTFWPENSSTRAHLKSACDFFGYEAEHLTPGRLARKVIKEVIELEWKHTFFGKKAAQMSADGSHWHYQFVEPGYHKYLYEYDLKSAYFTSLFHGKTLLWDERKGWLEDKGALERLRYITPYIPKWLRLVILGILASGKQQFYTRQEGESGGYYLKLCTIRKISYGAAFNCAHKAIHRTHAAMSRIHRIGVEHIKRIHTDSFALSIDCPKQTTQEIFDFLDQNKYKVSLKGQGSAHFVNLNEGIIGKKVIGERRHTLDTFREQNIKVPQYMLSPEEFEYHTMLRKLANQPEAELIEEPIFEPSQLSFL